jgi:hypothetical protein
MWQSSPREAFEHLDGLLSQASVAATELRAAMEAAEREEAAKPPAIIYQVTRTDDRTAEPLRHVFRLLRPDLTGEDKSKAIHEAFLSVPHNHPVPVFFASTDFVGYTVDEVPANQLHAVRLTASIEDEETNHGHTWTRTHTIAAHPDDIEAQMIEQFGIKLGPDWRVSFMDRFVLSVAPLLLSQLLRYGRQRQHSLVVPFAPVPPEVDAKLMELLGVNAAELAELQTPPSCALVVYGRRLDAPTYAGRIEQLIGSGLVPESYRSLLGA